MKKKPAYEPIQNYGIVGNLQTVALISLHGSIDFMSFPRVDSPTVFVKLLDAKKGGSFSVQPEHDDINYKQLYFPETAILITRFFSKDGIAELIDFMPLSESESDCTIIRKIKIVRGKMRIKMKCQPRFNYAKEIPAIEKVENGLSFESKSQRIFFFSNISLKYRNGSCSSDFELEESEEAYFVLSNSKEAASLISHKNYDNEFHNTKNFWQNWISQCQYKGRWREIVYRSALTLKLLSSGKYGSVVAAATFGLPEIIKGKRNWDYRYTWTRDAAFTMYVLLRMGFRDEAAAYISWIEELCRSRRMQVMYAVDGNTDLTERNIRNLEGYEGTHPVKIGNVAHTQFQLDIYGELIDTIYLYDKHGGAITNELWKEIVRQVGIVLDNWKKPDHGIWEIRKTKKEFLHSKLMCWVAVDRAIKIAERRSFPYPFVAWRETRDAIYNDIYKNYWNEKKQSYVQHKSSDELDGSVLLMPLVRIISPYDERWKKTMKAVEKELKSDVLIYRYRGKDVKAEGIGGKEGTFTLCSFWFVECLSKGGETERAIEFFEKMLGYANHLGLFSEQLGLRGEHLGNFPQAFTHLALISAAFQLDHALDKKRSKIFL